MNTPTNSTMPMYLSRDAAMDNFTTAMTIMNIIALISLIASLTTLWLMWKLSVYRHNLMSIIVYMTISQAIYDGSMITQICGMPPNMTIDANWHILTEWAECKCVQYAFVRFAGISTGLLTNVISILVAYVIYMQKRLYLPTYAILLFIMAPSALIGILFGMYFFDQVKMYGLIGKLGGLDNYNRINFIYAGVNVLILTVNIVAVLYISWELRKTGIICRRRRNHDDAMRPRATTANSITSASGTPLQNRNNIYPMFVLAKRLMLYPVVQVIVTFGTTYYGFDQDGEAIESYSLNVVHNEDHTQQTIELFFFAFLMPLAGLGYFFVFLFVQKGASDLLKQTLRIPIDWIRGVCCGYDPSQAQESEKAASKDGSNPPNISDSSATATSIADSNNLRERSWTDETVDFSSQLEYVRNQRTVIDINQGSAERIDRSDRMSYTYSDEESGSGSPKSTQHKEHSNSDESVSGNRQDWSYRDSTASATNYFEERISTFRSVSECTGVTVAKQLSTLKHINEEDVDELLEDELIELIEFTCRNSEKAVKAIRIGKEVNPIHIGKTDKK